ncbi:unnamed protein product [Rotaria socialis]|uniref:Peptidase C1A papain C-terminal domain-containing protein n=1 Tax=Rotaria socialis TaxID=392032 RepID=A0A820QX80_9BILA|nr:unnamed protein product [Rotaria socialis]CAF4428150.1 unnamed protein product [Rotaria socialis]CAF4465928.1 unnamed protein product [Rotaria socialis]CAF4472059.1 unnamed protein product [Rotaria socialis]CAF4817206.1 unnamed protein product [Rotaria socialis]
MQLVKFIIACLLSDLFASVGAVINRENLEAQEFPLSLDWRSKGVIAPIYDQGTSPDVVAIVMVETIESLHAIKTGNLIRGSVARVIDCCQQYTIDYECIARLGGICRDSDYPTTRGTCEPNACTPFSTFDKLVVFRGLDDEQLLPFIQNATLLVSIDAESFNFLDYSGGIFQDQTCSSTSIDDVLQLVGYGQNEMNEPFWIVKNSWGRNWGEDGYIRILRGKNICGIATQVYQPLILSKTTTPPMPTTTPSTASRPFYLQVSLLWMLFFFTFHENIFFNWF